MNFTNKMGLDLSCDTSQKLPTRKCKRANRKNTRVQSCLTEQFVKDAKTNAKEELTY